MLVSLGEVHAQNLINVKPATGALTAPVGPAAVGGSGDMWNAFGNLPGTGGTLTNATRIMDATGATVSGVIMTLSINSVSLSGYSSTAYGANPIAIMSSYVYDGNGDYFTVVFSGLPANKAYMLYGLSTGNAQGQGSTWWVDAANGHGTATATANFTSGSPLGTRDATQATNQGVCWVKIPATTTAAGALTFRLVKLNAAEDGTGGSGRAYFNGFQLQSLSAPVISSLTNQTAVAGTTTVLNPASSGVPTPSYQWRSNSVAIPGATNASLTLNNVQYAQNGTVYALVASNYVATVTNSMTLTVIVTPSITGLNNQAAPTGSTVTIPATVSGVPTPATKWQLNGTNLSDGSTGNGSTISGSATSTLVINNAQAADTGTYSLVATNAAGRVTNSMTLTVSAGNVAPSIVGPADQTVVQSNNATFTTSASGLPLPGLQWWVNGVAIPGATNSALTVTNATYALNGLVYSLVASNSAGMATNSATLYVLVPPAISQQPTNLTVVTGSPAAFSVTVSGVPAMKYQWTRNGSPIANATNAAYAIASALGADNGSVFSIIISNSVGVVTSSNAVLTVLSTMAGTFLPTNGAASLSPDQQLRITFTGGTPKLAYAGKKLFIYDASNNTLFATIDTSQFQTYTVDGATVSNAFVRVEQGSYFYYMPIAVYGTQAWITLNPTNRLAYGHTYYVNCDAGLFLDASGAAFPGISGTNTWRITTKASGPVTPTVSSGPTSIIVGPDGAGDFATLQGASDWIPQNNTLHRTLTILPGIYHDNTCFLQGRSFVTVTGSTTNRNDVQFLCPSASYASPSTGNGATLIVGSNDDDFRNFTLDNQVYLTNADANSLNNYSGSFAGRLLVLITTCDRMVFDNVIIKGGQDTYYASGSGYFHNCEVWGSVDFIYGSAALVFDQCNIMEIRNSGGPCTAPNTAYAQPYGMVFLNCNFPQALVANGYPYDVGTGNTTFQRAWGQDGMTAIINCTVGGQISTAGWGTFGYGGETTCRAREYGTTLMGGTSPTIAQRQAAGGYWLNTYDPDYTNSAMSPTDPLLAPPTGTNNRVAVAVNPVNYSVSTIFGNSYFTSLVGWTPATIPIIVQSPTNQVVSAGGTASFSVMVSGYPAPKYQWLKNGASFSGATNATLTITNVQAGDAATYSVIITNSAGSMTSSNVTLTVANSAPNLTPVPDQTINAGMMLTVTNVATDAEAPPQTLSFSMLAGPTNSTLSAAGIFSWRPPASQGGTTNPVSVKVADNGTPNLSATNQFIVMVNPVSKPGMGTISYEGTQLSFMITGGTTGPDYVVEASTNLTVWQTLLTTNSPPQPFAFTDTPPAVASKRFYRVRLSP